MTLAELYTSTYLIHDIKFDLNCIHRRFLVGLRDSTLGHASERTIVVSLNGTGLFVDESLSVNLFDESIFGVIRFKLLVNPSSVE